MDSKLNDDVELIVQDDVDQEAEDNRPLITDSPKEPATLSTPSSSSLLPVEVAQQTPADGSKDLISITRLALLIVGNIGCSVGLILINKSLMDYFNFKLVLLMTSLHFALPGVALEVFFLLFSRSTERAPIPLAPRLGLAFLNVLSIATMNLSLQANSVGFYQITKLLCIPCMIVIQGLLWRDFVSVKTKITLLVLLIGVGVTSVTDVRLNLIGGIWGAVAVLTTTLSQIYTGKLQSDYKVKPVQLLRSLMIVQFVIMFAFAVPLELIPQLLLTGHENQPIQVHLTV